MKIMSTNKKYILDKSFENELEREYRNSLHRFSDAELIVIFPEAVPYLKQKLGYLKKRYKKLSLEVLLDLSKVYCHDYKEGKEDFARWFGEEVVRVFKGEDLEKIKKQINKLKFLLYPPKEIKNRITPQMIERAKAVPFDSLINFNRAGFTICPFHSEKSPSLHFNKKNNTAHCFGCSWSGDTIKFLMAFNSLTFRDAVARLS